ncbi:Origin recognition complex subunit 6, partial [Galemys pyrenaicus]
MYLDLTALYMNYSLDRCLLGLNSNVGIGDLVVPFSCREAVNMASKTLQSYKSSVLQTQRKLAIGQQTNDSAGAPWKKEKTAIETPAKETEKVVQISHKPHQKMTHDHNGYKRKILENLPKHKRL